MELQASLSQSDMSLEDAMGKVVDLMQENQDLKGMCADQSTCGLRRRSCRWRKVVSPKRVNAKSKNVTVCYLCARGGETGLDRSGKLGPLFSH